jgi:hypothetical protein
VSGSVSIKQNNVTAKPIYRETIKLVLLKTCARRVIGICNGEIKFNPRIYLKEEKNCEV